MPGLNSGQDITGFPAQMVRDAAVIGAGPAFAAHRGAEALGAVRDVFWVGDGKFVSATPSDGSGFWFGPSDQKRKR